MSDIISKLNEQFRPYGSNPGASLHDWCYDLGRQYGWKEVIEAIDNLLNGKGEPDVPTPEDRVPADEYARRRTASS